MENFHALGLPRPLLQALEKMKFDTPTPIQAQAIPPALQGRDVLGTAQTGTGKTAAFAIPMLARILAQRVDHGQGQQSHGDNKHGPGPGHNPHGQHAQPGIALIMTPTRELSMQVLDAAKLMLSHAAHIKTALLIGGQSMHAQLQQLRARPRVIVGTPGRINDHLQQGSLNLSTADFLVLDETDRMLDMGFGPQIERIVKRMPKHRQTLMFSATMPDHIVKVANTYLNNPVRVTVGAVNAPVRKIQQDLVRLQVSEKYDTLLKELRARPGSILIFVRTKRGADRMAKKLNDDKQQAIAIHGNLNQNQRNRVIQSFRDMKHRIMVATDVASRGLDIPHIEHVINYDLPQVAEDYIHRIGRTARAGKEGAAVCFITPEDHELWGEIHKLLNPGEKPLPRQEGGSGPARKSNQQHKNNRHNRSGFQHRRGGAGGGEARREPRSEHREPRSENREPRSEHRSEHSAGEGRREHRGERSEHRGQRSEPRGERSEHRGEQRTGAGASDARRPHSGGPKKSGERRFGGGGQRQDGVRPHSSGGGTGGGRREGRAGMKRGKKY